MREDEFQPFLTGRWHQPPLAAQKDAGEVFHFEGRILRRHWTNGAWHGQWRIDEDYRGASGLAIVFQVVHYGPDQGTRQVLTGLNLLGLIPGVWGIPFKAAGLLGTYNSAKVTAEQQAAISTGLTWCYPMNSWDDNTITWQNGDQAMTWNRLSA